MKVKLEYIWLDGYEPTPNLRGKTKVVDLHCHYLNPEVNAKTAHLNAAQHDATHELQTAEAA